MVLDSPPARPAVTRKKDPQRSALTNGKLLPGAVDQRSAWVRRCKDIISQHLVDLGGEENCSSAERSIVRRASVMTVELERLEAKFATAGQASADDLEVYQRCANSLRRLLESVGLRRRPHDVTQGPLKLTMEELARKLEERGLPPYVFGDDVPVLDQKGKAEPVSGMAWASEEPATRHED
jgi:hypothetical protein